MKLKSLNLIRKSLPSNESNINKIYNILGMLCIVYLVLMYRKWKYNENINIIDTGDSNKKK